MQPCYPRGKVTAQRQAAGAGVSRRQRPVFVWVGMAEASRLSKLTSKRRQAVLDQLRQGWSIQRACDAAGISRQAYYNWRDADQGFAQEADAARESGVDHLEDVARERALADSDTLLIFMLKANRPTKYRDTQRLEHTGIDGTPLTVVITERPDGPQ